jgi:hypothetical protein
MAAMRNRLALLVALTFGVPALTFAQPGGQEARREVAVTVGPAYLSHGDSPLGWGSTVGVSAAFPIWRRLAVRVDAHRSFGPELNEHSCASYDRPCTGIGRSGARDLTIWSGSAMYYFQPSGVQAFVRGGVDVLHFAFLSTVTFVGGPQVRITEEENKYTTMGILLGGGVRIPIGSRFVVRPEVTIYDGTILAGTNLTQVRTSVAFGYRW